MADRIITCSKCGNEFLFTTGEQVFYHSRGLNDPRICQDCRNKRKQNSILSSISTEWKRDAIKEKSKYFYDDGEILQLTNGEKYFVIGRKGSGKTAIADYINHKSPNTFTKKISFKNFPFNELYSFINDSYTSPNQYITIWKYVIYSTVCTLLAQNDQIESSILTNLQKLYGDNTEKRLNKLIEKWTATSFNLEILGVGVGGERAKAAIPSWIEKAEILEEVVVKYTDNSRYYVLIDELDENYTVFPREEDKKRYFDLITSLFKAIQDIKNTILEETAIYPIVFLRDDIFNLIVDPDKNKWNDYIINLNWDIAKIRNMLKHRLGVICKTRFNTFDDAWTSVFFAETIAIGNRQEKEVNTFEYISRLAQLRPRDYIEYIRECAELAIKRGEEKISGQVVKYNNKAFSNYLLNEIKDEAHSALPEFDSVIALLPIIRKQVFSSSEFKSAYIAAVEKGNLSTSKSSETILELLFEYDVIGNAPKMKGKAVFRYEYPNAKINHNEKIIIHRGLYGALQIF